MNDTIKYLLAQLIMAIVVTGGAILTGFIIYAYVLPFASHIHDKVEQELKQERTHVERNI